MRLSLKGTNLRTDRITLSLWIVLSLVAMLMPLFADGYILRAFSVFYLYLVLGAGLTIVVTYAGLLDLGYIAFFGIGAYTYALLNTYYAVPFFPALAIGMLIAAGFGLILGFPTLRVRGDYLAVVTLGFGEIIRILLLNIWGPHGMIGIRPPISIEVVGSIDNLYTLFYIVSFLPVPVALWLLSRIGSGGLAQTWFAIRDNEVAARSCGVNSVKRLLLAFTIGAAFAGLAGVIFAGVQRYVSPGSFILEESILVLSIVIIAGGRSLWRLIFAAAILIFLPEVLRALANYRMLFFGMLLTAYVVADETFRTWIGSRRAVKSLPDVPVLHLESSRHTPVFMRQNSIRNGWTISVTGLTMCFGGITAVDNVSFSVRLGSSVTALIGPNGAGKTTLFNCISGHYRPDAGKITLPDIRTPYTSYESARAGLARTFQTPQLFQSMTVQENVAVGARLRYKGSYQDDVVIGILEYLGLSALAKTNVRSLPLGIQRLTEFGRALALCPDAILLDEIASGLNSGEKQEMSYLIRRLSEEIGVGFLIIEHDMDFVLPLASDVLVLDDGKLIARGTASEVVGNPLVIDAYLGTCDDIP